MKRLKVAQFLILGVFAATFGSTAMAVDKQTRVLLSLGIEAPLGMSAPESAAQRTITLSPNTKYVNVDRGEVIKFLVDGKSFTWHFDTFGTPAFEFSAITPKDVNARGVVVYVGPDLTPGKMPG